MLAHRFHKCRKGPHAWPLHMQSCSLVIRGVERHVCWNWCWSMLPPTALQASRARELEFRAWGAGLCEDPVWCSPSQRAKTRPTAKIYRLLLADVAVELSQVISNLLSVEDTISCNSKPQFGGRSIHTSSVVCVILSLFSDPTLVAGLLTKTHGPAKLCNEE